MDTQGSVGLTPVILLVSFILIAATASSVFLNNSEELSEEDLEQLIGEAVDEISTYLQIKDIYGKYCGVPPSQNMEKIALLVTPLFSQEIDLSTLTISLFNGDSVKLIPYSGEAAFISSYSLFEHAIWTNISPDMYSVIVVLDDDSSILNYNSFNKNSDMVFLVIDLPEDMLLKKGDQMTISLYLSPGVAKTITVTAPLPMRQVVHLD